jgi:hypothetical protein
MPLIYTPSASLFDRAKAAFAKIQAKHVPDRQHGERDAIIAIVFSALALEAFINEVGDFAAYPNRENAEQDPQSVSMIGSMLGEIEESRGSMQQKFLMAKWIFSQQEYNRAGQPYLDFAILVQVRNALAHVKDLGIFEYEGPMWLGGPTSEFNPPPKFIQQLETRGLLGDATSGGGPVHWTERLETLAMARWSCETASNMIRSLIDVMPNSPFANVWRYIYRSYFDMARPPQYPL